jgi:hypothetical protein
VTTKAADDLEAIRAGLRRIEEEKQRMLNGDTSPEPVAVEDYQHECQEIDQFYPTPWGVIAKPKVQVTPTVGSYRATQHGDYEYWNGKAWVTREYWEDYGDQS